MITANSKWITTTKYYEEFLRYYQMAKTQQEECNLGIIKHADSSVPDDLMKHVELYDVVERKYAGFSQIVNDVFYGFSEDHPYWNKMTQGHMTKQREARRVRFKRVDLFVFVSQINRICYQLFDETLRVSQYASVRDASSRQYTSANRHHKRSN
jgi:hypothetical protein